MRILAGLDRPDDGTVERSPASLTVGYLAQEPDAAPGETLHHYLARRAGVAAAEAELDRQTAALAEGRRPRWTPTATPSTASWPSAAPTSRPGPPSVCADLGLPADRLDVAVG